METIQIKFDLRILFRMKFLIELNENIEPNLLKNLKEAISDKLNDNHIIESSKFQNFDSESRICALVKVLELTNFKEAESSNLNDISAKGIKNLKIYIVYIFDENNDCIHFKFSQQLYEDSETALLPKIFIKTLDQNNYAIEIKRFVECLKSLNLSDLVNQEPLAFAKMATTQKLPINFDDYKKLGSLKYFQEIEPEIPNFDQQIKYFQTEKFLKIETGEDVFDDIDLQNEESKPILAAYPVLYSDLYEPELEIFDIRNILETQKFEKINQEKPTEILTTILEDYLTNWIEFYSKVIGTKNSATAKILFCSYRA